MLNSQLTDSYWGDYSVGTRACVSINRNNSAMIDCNSRDGVFGAGDTDGTYNQTAIGVVDSTKQNHVTTWL